MNCSGATEGLDKRRWMENVGKERKGKHRRLKYSERKNIEGMG
jgi:hypothetical protein